MKLEWKYDEERGEWEAYSDHGVFRIAVCNDGTFTLAESDRELGCGKATWGSLQGAKDYANERWNDLIDAEVTR